MIIIDTALARRAAEARPIRVGMVGAGFMGSGIALQIAQSVPGVQICAIAARQTDQARAVFEASRKGEAVRVTQSVDDVSRAIREDAPVVTEDPAVMAAAKGLDAIIEVTGSMDYALRGVETAISTGKHVVLMNAELDGTIGPLLAQRARAAGVVYTNADGDQPGVQMNLIRFVKGIGVKPVLAGNIKGLQDTDRTPDTQRGFAEKWGQNVAMVTSFADGTKIAFEQAIVANGTGMRVARRGMIGPDPTGKDPTAPLRPLEDFVDMLRPHIDPDGPGIVDFVVGARPGPGVFVLGTHDDPRQQHYLALYKLGDGPFYLFYTPYHLCHFEVPMTVARAVLFADAALTPLSGPQVGVVATAKRDLGAGDQIDGIGGFMTYGQAENYDVIARDRLLPMGLAEGAILKRPVSKGAVLHFEDVDLPSGSRVAELYGEMERQFSRVPEMEGAYS
ncbi:NAD(P)H-dependent oxidoreductase [Roseinatronobacter bogoriensis]|uniref:NAD(P)-dependent oxidoreductase n=1 Tax=Roseinatronobacter bogoriensis subsp. barguzinensis TaxID=441209 RepID=A0A2K8K9N9_9RHOB|nr:MULTISPECIES: SAF domain-containing protein [Rhodobaca]ATX65656.1 NAD(P)-dependent oxidoreductase [Rhodobaca barguzinensis]MBB4208403.1 putative homoserine dehydrogenase-like protein [Rhodobaca bogoriensis DSM 18756]TDW39044.1 putative homoserine dehydrogenase-like protein [Rhodobaca barguzinensis]TDY68773.1 putative homoserine dehydrogenase-like protein [Rhodobaca bogoriensis DSM 18756]